jgi:redox-sensitive bicupin YhaK (pirin superfamily)
LVPATGKIDVNGVVASAGDGVAISDERLLKVSGLEDSEIVLVDVA